VSHKYLYVETLCKPCVNSPLVEGKVVKLNMKKEIADYIKKLATRDKPLTDSQTRLIAYWELVAFSEERK
jgi:hypothetical protein